MFILYYGVSVMVILGMLFSLPLTFLVLFINHRTGRQIFKRRRRELIILTLIFFGLMFYYLASFLPLYFSLPGAILFAFVVYIIPEAALRPKEFRDQLRREREAAKLKQSRTHTNSSTSSRNSSTRSDSSSGWENDSEHNNNDADSKSSRDNNNEHQGSQRHQEQSAATQRQLNLDSPSEDLGRDR